MYEYLNNKQAGVINSFYFIFNFNLLFLQINLQGLAIGNGWMDPLRQVINIKNIYI